MIAKMWESPDQMCPQDEESRGEDIVSVQEPEDGVQINGSFIKELMCEDTSTCETCAECHEK